jgi:hypothetical protein
MYQDSRGSDVSIDRCSGFEHDSFVGGDVTGYGSRYLDILGVDICLDEAALGHSDCPLAVDRTLKYSIHENFPGSQEFALDACRSCDDRAVCRLGGRFGAGLRGGSGRSGLRGVVVASENAQLSIPPQVVLIWSGQRDSNPRHSAWEADTLPAELCPPSRATTLT